MNYKKQVGQFGENLAREYLEKKGYKIIDQNIKISYQEIDLVARYKGKIIFIEVKTRTSASFGTADETITNAKIENLKKAMGAYLDVNNLDPECVQLDLFSVDIEKQKKIANIKHYKDLF